MSCPYTPEQNGVAEQKHRHLTEMSITLLNHASLPLKFWYHVFACACYLINRLPSISLSNLSPYEILFQDNPTFSHLKTFGCACYPLLRPYNKHKLEPRTAQYVFLGYTQNTKGYICYHIETEKFITTRHVVFDETIFPFASSLFSSHSPAHVVSSPSVSNSSSLLPFIAVSLPQPINNATGSSSNPPNLPSIPNISLPTVNLPCVDGKYTYC